MFGVRFAPLLRQAASRSMQTLTIPKFQYSLINKYFMSQLEKLHLFFSVHFSCQQT